MFDFFKDVRLDFSSVYVCRVAFFVFCGCFVVKYGACLAVVLLWLVNSDINGFEFSFMQFIREWQCSIGETHFTVKFVHSSDGQSIKVGFASNKDFLALLLDVMTLNFRKHIDVILNTFLFRLAHLIFWGICSSLVFLCYSHLRCLQSISHKFFLHL